MYWQYKELLKTADLLLSFSTGLYITL